MVDRFWCAQIGDGREICVSPLAKSTLDQMDYTYHLGDDYGYFIYECDRTKHSAGIEVLAKAASYTAAMRLVDIYIMSKAKNDSQPALGA